MADEFDFFSNDCNNWNYNEFTIADRLLMSGIRGDNIICRKELLSGWAPFGR
jgi:hypothetical protein